MIDVQINEFVLSLFPQDYIARRRAEGISLTQEPMPASEAELRRFACDFRIPGEVMPMFVIGKPLTTLSRGAVASVRLIDGKLAVLFDNQPAFRLERISSDTFGISGLPPGMTFQFKEDSNTVREVVLDMKGLEAVPRQRGSLVSGHRRQLAVKAGLSGQRPVLDFPS